MGGNNIMNWIKPGHCCAVAVFVGLILSVACWRTICPVTPDSCNYMVGALSLQEGSGYQSIKGGPQVMFPPGFSGLIAATLSIISDPVNAGRLISLLFSTASILLVYFLVRHIASPWQAAATALLFALLPLRVRLSGMVWTESTYTALLFIALLLLFKWYKTGESLWAVLVGITLGVAYLIRPEGLLILGVVAGFALLGFRNSKKRLAQLLLMVAIFMLVAAPYVAYLHKNTGKWGFTNKTAYNLAVADAMMKASPGTPWARIHRLNNEGEFKTLNTQLHLRSMARRAVGNEFRMLERLPYLLSPALFAFVGLGLIVLIARNLRTPAVATILLVCAAPLIYLPVFHWEDRMLLTVLLLGLVAAVVGITTAVDLAVNRWRRGSLAAIMAVAVVFLLAYNVEYNGLLRSPASCPRQAVGLWIHSHFPQQQSLATSGRLIPACFFAGKRLVLLPYEPLDVATEYVREQGTALMLLPKAGHESSICAYAAAPRDTDKLVVCNEWADYTLVRLRDG